MWVSLADENLVEHYKKNFHPDFTDKAPELIVSLLEELSKKTYAEKLSAVTSVGQLYLTSALSWNDKSDNHSVHISQRIDAGKPVLAISFHTRSLNKSVARRYCSLEEAIEYIDLCVMRLLLEKYGEL